MCPCTLTFLASPLTSNFTAPSRCSTRRIVYIIARARAHIHTHAGNKRGGVGVVGGEFDRRIFNAIKNKPLPSRVPYLLSRLDCDATRRDTAHVAFPNGNKLRIFRRGEIFIGQSVHWRGGDSSTPGRHQHVATCLQPTARSIEVWMSGERQPLTVS